MMRADVARGATAMRPAAVRPAGMWLRLAAYLVDWLVIVIVGSTFVSVGALQLYVTSGETRHDAPDASIYAFFVISALTIPVWLLMTFTGWSWFGRSVGKLAMGLRIVDLRGRSPGLLRGFVRLFVYSIENLALLLAPVVARPRAGWAIRCPAGWCRWRWRRVAPDWRRCCRRCCSAAAGRCMTSPPVRWSWKNEQRASTGP